MRVKAVVSYDGTSFKGFQRQKSIKETITTAIEDVLLSIGINSKIRGSGRTDAGVHASGQVIDFELPNFWKDLKRVKDVINQKLDYIYIKHISYVDDSFHARFSAQKRIYRYMFKTTNLSIFEKRYISFYPTFNQDLLKKSLKLFEGTHNFTNFMKQGSITHTNIRTIYRAYYKKYNNYHIIFFEADGFLRSQVRFMVDMSMQVALKKITLTQQIKQLELKKRYITTLAPAEGLYLARVIY